MNETELIYKAQKGDSESFGKLYDAHIAKIYRFVYLKVGQRQNAEDLAHQVFMNAWKNIGSYKPKGVPFSSWLYKIASNAVIDFYRTAKPYVDIEAVGEEKLGIAEEDAERDLETSIEMERIGEALRLLTDDEQSVVIMKFVNELSNKEISDSLAKTEGAIRVIQHRALRRLKKILEETPPRENN
jgi:RNA polymerase sigma-70 factor (ECF subfamily)